MRSNESFRRRNLRLVISAVITFWIVATLVWAIMLLAHPIYAHYY